MNENKDDVGPTGFDPSRCQWCGDEGFDLEGLAHHVWTRCEVVEQLAQANIENVRQWHQRNYEDAQKRRDRDRSSEAGETQSGSTVGESPDPKGIAPVQP